MRTFGISILVLFSMVGTFGISDLANATTVQPGFENVPPADPLVVSHLVIRGIVRGVSPTEVDLGARADLPPVVLSGARVRVHVLEVLRGVYDDPEITVVVLRDYSKLDPGKEFVICALRNDLWNDHEGMWVTGDHLGLYERQGTHWQRTSPGSIPIAQIHDDKPIDDTALRARLSRGDLPYLSNESDLIARGTVIATAVTHYVAPNGQRGTLKRCLLQISELLKGAESDAVVEFVVPLSDDYVPKWYSYFTPGIEQNQECLVFLKQGEMGLYLFAGVNSILFISGDSLLFDKAITYARSTLETERAIRAEVGNGTK